MKRTVMTHACPLWLSLLFCPWRSVANEDFFLKWEFRGNCVISECPFWDLSCCMWLFSSAAGCLLQLKYNRSSAILGNSIQTPQAPASNIKTLGKDAFLGILGPLNIHVCFIEWFLPFIQNKPSNTSTCNVTVWKARKDAKRGQKGLDSGAILKWLEEASLCTFALGMHFIFKKRIWKMPHSRMLWAPKSNRKMNWWYSDAWLCNLESPRCVLPQRDRQSGRRLRREYSRWEANSWHKAKRFFQVGLVSTSHCRLGRLCW